jgi:hypothetical protein
MDGACWLFAPEWIRRRRPELLILRGVSDSRRSFSQTCPSSDYLLSRASHDCTSPCAFVPSALPERSRQVFLKMLTTAQQLFEICSSSLKVLPEKQASGRHALRYSGVQDQTAVRACVCVCHQARSMSANHHRPTLRCLSQCDHWKSETILILVRDSWRAFARRSGFAALSAGENLVGGVAHEYEHGP